MCEPATLAITAITLSAIGTGVGVYSSVQQGKEAQRQANAQAEQARQQAKLASERSVIAQVQGEQEYSKRSRLLSQDIGSAYANMAGNGLLVDGSSSLNGTVGNVVSSTTREGAYDLSNIKDNTAINVWQHQSQQSSLMTSANNLTAEGKASKRAGNISALATGISGVGTMIGNVATMGSMDSVGWFGKK